MSKIILILTLVLFYGSLFSQNNKPVEIFASNYKRGESKAPNFQQNVSFRSNFAIKQLFEDRLESEKIASGNDCSTNQSKSKYQNNTGNIPQKEPRGYMNFLTSIAQGINMVMAIRDRSTRVKLLNGKGNVISFKQVFAKGLLNITQFSSDLYIVKPKNSEKKSSFVRKIVIR